MFGSNFTEKINSYIMCFMFIKNPVSVMDFNPNPASMTKQQF